MCSWLIALLARSTFRADLRQGPICHVVDLFKADAGFFSGIVDRREEFRHAWPTCGIQHRVMHKRSQVFANFRGPLSKQGFFIWCKVDR